MSIVSVIVAIVKGRSLASCIPCVLFPRFLIVLLRLRTSKRVGQVRCEACHFWNPVCRDTCARCGLDIRDPDFVVEPKGRGRGPVGRDSPGKAIVEGKCAIIDLLWKPAVVSQLGV